MSMKCRQACGACCIAPSINQPYYGMPQGKAAGERCIHLDPIHWSCAIWGSEHYPDTCRRFLPEASVCGSSRQDAITLIAALELHTQG